MKGWSEQPAAAHDHAAEQSVSPRRTEGPPPAIEHAPGVFLDAAAAARGEIPPPSAIIIEEGGHYATDPHYPGGARTEVDPAYLVPWSAQAEGALTRIAHTADEFRRKAYESAERRVFSAADPIAARLAEDLRSSSREAVGVEYDAARAARGRRTIPCFVESRRADGTCVVTEVGRNLSESESWTTRLELLVPETDANRARLEELARRIDEYLDKARRRAGRAAMRIGLPLVQEYLSERAHPR